MALTYDLNKLGEEQDNNVLANPASPAFVPDQGASLNTPLFGTIDTNTQTVQGQITGLMSAGNPLLERAKTKAAQAANKRGLLNSSMGVQAGQEAVLSAALPISQFDAAQYSNQQKQNQDWQNKYGLESNAYQYQTGLAQQDYEQQLGTGSYAPTPLTDASGNALYETKTALDEEGNTTSTTQTPLLSGGGLIAAQTEGQLQVQREGSEQNLTAQTQREVHEAEMENLATANKDYLARLDTGLRGELVELERKYMALQQESISAATMYSQYLGSIADIQSAPDITAVDKTTMIANLKTALETTMETIEGIRNKPINTHVPTAIETLENSGFVQPTPEDNLYSYRNTSSGTIVTTQRPSTYFEGEDDYELVQTPNSLFDTAGVTETFVNTKTGERVTTPGAGWRVPSSDWVRYDGGIDLGLGGYGATE